jgi:hypothetical protein
MLGKMDLNWHCQGKNYVLWCHHMLNYYRQRSGPSYRLLPWENSFFDMTNVSLMKVTLRCLHTGKYCEARIMVPS